MRRQRGRDPATIARNGLRTTILVLFAIFFATPLVWLVLATTKNGEQLVFGAPFGWGSIHQLISNWHRLTAFEGDAYAGWFGNTVEYTGSALLIVLLGNAFSLILPFSFFPFGVYLAYLHFSTATRQDMLSAARMDGCSELQVFMRIAIPLAKPVVALIALFSFVANWNNYFLPLVMLPSSDGYPLQVGMVLLPRNSPVLALGVLVSILPVLFVFVVSQRYVAAGLTTGSTTD